MDKQDKPIDIGTLLTPPTMDPQQALNFVASMLFGASTTGRFTEALQAKEALDTLQRAILPKS